MFKFKNKFLIGMIHLPPLFGMEGFPGIDYCIDKAKKDLENLEKAGFDGALIENDNDNTPHTEFVSSAQVASMAIISWELSKIAKIPLGVQLLLNDWKASFEICKLINAKFTRLDVFVDDTTCRWCDIIPNTEEIVKYKETICPELALFTDIQVKYKTLLNPNKTLKQSAEEAIKYKTNAIIITGSATGVETPIEKVKEIKTLFPEETILIGAGLNKYNILEQLKYADGAIVGTSIKNGDFVDYAKAKELVDIKNNNFNN